MDRFPRILGIARGSRKLLHEHDRAASGSGTRKQRVVPVLRFLWPPLPRVFPPFDPSSDQSVQAIANSNARARIAPLCAGASHIGPFGRRDRAIAHCRASGSRVDDGLTPRDDGLTPLLKVVMDEVTDALRLPRQVKLYLAATIRTSGGEITDKNKAGNKKKDDDEPETIFTKKQPAQTEPS
jgi:hypothetical protein